MSEEKPDDLEEMHRKAVRLRHKLNQLLAKIEEKQVEERFDWITKVDLALEAIREEVRAETRARGWEFWPLQVKGKMTDDGLSVTLTKNPGSPHKIEVSDTFPRDVNPEFVAREMCDALQEREK